MPYYCLPDRTFLARAILGIHGHQPRCSYRLAAFTCLLFAGTRISHFPPASSSTILATIHLFSQRPPPHAATTSPLSTRTPTTTISARSPSATGNLVNIVNSAIQLPFPSALSPPDLAILPHLEQLPLCVSCTAYTLRQGKANELIFFAPALHSTGSHFRSLLSPENSASSFTHSLFSQPVGSAGFFPFVLTDTEHCFSSTLFFKTLTDVFKQQLNLAHFIITFFQPVSSSSCSQSSAFALLVAAALGNQPVSALKTAIMHSSPHDVISHNPHTTDIDSFVGLV